MRFRPLGILVRVHWTLLLMPPLLALSGLGPALLTVTASMLAHEAAHALAARAVGVHVRELMLTPFGGALRIEGIWGYRPCQVALVALAGPAMSLLVMTVAAALAYAGAATASAAGTWVRVNLLLAAFNLLPALPLDGGRVLVAALGSRMSTSKALRVGVVLGGALGAALLALALWQFAAAGIVNMTIVLCGAYLLLSGPSERRAAAGAELMSLLSRRDELREEGMLPLSWIAADQRVRCNSALARLRARRVHRIAVYDGSLSLIGVVEERDLIAAVRRGEPSSLGPLAKARAAARADPVESGL